MKKIQSLLSGFVHAIKVRFSKQYANECRIKELLLQIKHEVRDQNYHIPKVELVKKLTGELHQISPAMASEALIAIAASSNYACMQFAIDSDREFGKPCADRLMETARRYHLPLCGHGDRACWAGTNLSLSKKWYRVSGTLTQALADEIEQGFKKIAWAYTPKE